MFVSESMQQIPSEPGQYEASTISAIDRGGAKILNPDCLPSCQLQVDGGWAWWVAVRVAEVCLFIGNSLIIHQKEKRTFFIVSSFVDREPGIGRTFVSFFCSSEPAIGGRSNKDLLSSHFQTKQASLVRDRLVCCSALLVLVLINLWQLPAPSWIITQPSCIRAFYHTGMPTWFTLPHVLTGSNHWQVLCTAPELCWSCLQDQISPDPR